MILPPKKEARKGSLPAVSRDKTPRAGGGGSVFSNIAALFNVAEDPKDAARRRGSKGSARDDHVGADGSKNAARALAYGYQVPTPPKPTGRGRAHRVLTLSKDIVYDQSLEAQAPEAARSGRSSAASTWRPASSRASHRGQPDGSLGLTMRAFVGGDRPTSAGADPLPMEPSFPSESRRSGSHSLNETRASSPKEASSSRLLYRSAPTPRQRAGTPAWSLRYCEFAGSAWDDPGRGKSRDPAERSHSPGSQDGEWMQPSPLEQARKKEEELRSSTHPENGKGKRVASQLERMKTKERGPSRLVARRHAIQSHGPHRLQAVAAVNIMRLQNPTLIRTITKLCEAGRGSTTFADEGDEDPVVAPGQAKELTSKELASLSKETGMPTSEIQTLHQVYEHYDPGRSGNLDRTEISSLLADIGLQPRTREEKAEINEILNEQVARIAVAKSGDKEPWRVLSRPSVFKVTFESFLKLVQAVSEKLRELQSIESMQLFQLADVDDSGTLEMAETRDLMESKLGMKTHNEEEEAEMVAIFKSCDGDADAALTFEEFQEFIQRLRAKLLMMRREREMTIAKAFQLNKTLVKEFTSDLPRLWDMFQRYDHRNQGVVSKEDLPTILMDVGIAPSVASSTEYAVTQKIVNELGLTANDFPRVLRLINETRRRCKCEMEDTLHEKYAGYDKDGDGSISMSEIYQILGEFRMLPTSKEQQHEIVFVIERLDKDGSGTFDFEEFADFFQKLTEHVRMSERERDRAEVAKFGFTDLHISIMRRVYVQLSLEARLQGVVNLHTLGRSLADLRSLLGLWAASEDDTKLFASAILREVDRTVGFVEFCRMVKVGLLDATEEDAQPALDRMKAIQWW